MNENKNTKRKTDGDLKLFNSYLHSVNELRNIDVIPPDQLNDHICGFLLSVTKQDGDEYEPTTIRGFVSSIDRYLRSKNYKFSIINSHEFERSRQVLKNKQKQVNSLGKGNKSKAADPLDETMIKTFHECGILGDGSPASLIHSLWLICIMNFGMRTGQEVHNLKWGDIQLKEDAIGEYLQYDTERQTKTRSGVNLRDTRLSKPKAYETSYPQRDPVHLYKLYKSKRPAEMLNPDSPFFLSVAHKEPAPYGQWYKKQPMGINKLYGIMNEMKSAANINTDKRIIPYSARKHLVQKLDDAGVPSHQIVQITGHKNVNSINNYSKLNPQQSKNISDILSNAPERSGAIVPFDSHQAQFLSTNRVLSTSASCSTSGYGGMGYPPHPMLANNTFTGPVSFHFGETSTMHQTAFSHSQTQYNQDWQEPQSQSPHSHRPLKRIRRISSSSDSE